MVCILTKALKYDRWLFKFLKTLDSALKHFVFQISFFLTVVSSVLQNVPLMLRKKQIHVEEVRLDGQKVEKEADVESLGSPCTIEVSGFKDTTSKDSVEFYFDNKRSGGGGVEEVKGEVEDGVLLITFDNEESK